jgi:hypothetical protein
VTASIGFDIYAKDRASGTFNHVGNSADRAGGKLHRMGKIARVAGAGLAAGLGLAAVGAYKLGKMAAEDQKSTVKLALALRNNAHATKGQVAQTERWIAAQGKALGVTDEELRPALGKLVTATHSVGKAQRLASLAMNVSAGTGKSLEAVSMALMKAQNGNVTGLSRLGVATKDAHGKTMKFEQIQKNLAKTFRGQAAAAANTAAGRFARLKLILSETGESIGYKLLPPATKFAGWLLAQGPTLTRFGNWMNANVVPAMRRMGATIQSEVVPALVSFGHWFGDKIAPVIADVAQNRIKTLVSAFHSVRGSLKQNEPQLRTFATWLKKGAEVAVRVLGPALKILGGVQIKMLTTYIKFGIHEIAWFVKGMQAAGRAAQSVGGFVRDMAAKVSGAVSSFTELVRVAGVKMNKLVDKVKAIPGRITGAIGDLGSLLYDAGRAVIQGLIDGIGDMVRPLTDKLRGIAGSIKGAFTSALQIHSPSRVFLGIGADIMRGLVQGIERHTKPVSLVMDKVAALVKAKGQKLRDLLSARNEFAGGFQMGTSIFGADTGAQPMTAANLLKFQTHQLAQSQRVRADVNTLIKRGLSKSLIKQLQSQGESGIAQLHALALGTQADVTQANALDKQTQANYAAAGMQAGTAVYGDSIAVARREDRQAKALAKALAKEMRGHTRKELERMEFRLEGRTLVATLKKEKRENGNKPLGLS